jgi:hypothetical protein
MVVWSSSIGLIGGSCCTGMRQVPAALRNAISPFGVVNKCLPLKTSRGSGRKQARVRHPVRHLSTDGSRDADSS